jgi:hypothetical protein
MTPSQATLGVMSKIYLGILVEESHEAHLQLRVIPQVFLMIEGMPVALAWVHS